MSRVLVVAMFAILLPGSSSAQARGAAPRQAGSAPAPAVTRDTAPPAPVVILREAYEYPRTAARRDPFVSLLNTEDLRPTLGDLRLTGILYDHTGQQPIATLRDVGTRALHNVTVGATLGRMRVTAIRPGVVIFTIEEFGMNRRDSLMLRDTTQVRSR